MSCCATLTTSFSLFDSVCIFSYRPRPRCLHSTAFSRHIPVAVTPRTAEAGFLSFVTASCIDAGAEKSLPSAAATRPSILLGSSPHAMLLAGTHSAVRCVASHARSACCLSNDDSKQQGLWCSGLGLQLPSQLPGFQTTLKTLTRFVSLTCV